MIADRHLKGLERGWLQAFVRPFTMKGTPPTPTRLAAASWVPGRGQAAAAAQQDAWVSLDGAGNEDGVWDGDGDAVVDQIQVALGELKASQTALGDEVVDQLGILGLGLTVTVCFPWWLLWFKKAQHVTSYGHVRRRALLPARVPVAMLTGDIGGCHGHIPNISRKAN